MADFTTHLGLPLRWDHYVTDRALIQVAFERLDIILSGAGDGTISADDVPVDAPTADATWTSVQAALDDISARLVVIEAFVNA